MAKKFFIEITDPEKNKTHISEFNQGKIFHSIEACKTFLDDNFVVDNKNNLVINHWEIDRISNSVDKISYLGIDGRQTIELQKGINIYLPHENDDQNPVSVSNWIIRTGSDPAVSDKLENKYIVLKDNKALVAWTDSMAHELRPEAVLRLYALRGQYPVLEKSNEGNDNDDSGNNNSGIRNLDNPQSVWEDQKEITEYRFFTEGKNGVEIYETKPNTSWLVKFVLTWEEFKTICKINGVSNKDRVKNITIPATINGKLVTSVGDDAFYGCIELANVNIANSITSIEDWAFKDCVGLTNVNIPNSVTSVGQGAFEGCVGLTNVNIPNSVASIGNSAFSDCSGLINVEIPNSVTYIGLRVFKDCAALKKIVIPNSVASIEFDAFEGCTNLRNVIIPDSVISIGQGAFDGCTELTNITLSKFVTHIGWYVFQSCTKLKSVTINAITPPFLEEYVFHNNAPNRKIFVPKEALSVYKKKWVDYKDDIFPIE